MRAPAVTLVLILTYLQSECVTSCGTFHTKPPMYDYRCEAYPSTETTLLQTAYPQCLWRCLMKRTCQFINHNSATGVCQLGLGQCETLRADAGFMVVVFEPPRHDCLHWGSKEEAGRRPVQGRGPKVIYAARIANQNAWLIGKFTNNSQHFWANQEGARIGPIVATDQGINILTIDDACIVPWVSLTAGQTLPVGVVGGGRLADGSVTYVAKVTHGDQEMFGYYNNYAELAYYEQGGVQTTTSMELLVVI